MGTPIQKIINQVMALALLMMLMMFNSVSPQQVPDKFKIRNANGKCLTYDGINLDLVAMACSLNDPKQQWNFQGAGATQYICNVDNNMCATLRFSGNNTVPDPVALTSCRDHTRQWSFNDIQSPASTGNIRLRVSDRSSIRYCAQLDSTNNKVIVDECIEKETPPSQQWKQVKVTTTKYLFQNANGQCLSYDYNKDLVLKTCNAGDTKLQWTITGPDSNFKLCNVQTNLCATVIEIDEIKVMYYNVTLDTEFNLAKTYSFETISKQQPTRPMYGFKRVQGLPKRSTGPGFCLDHLIVNGYDYVFAMSCTSGTNTPTSQQWIHVPVD